MSSSTEQATPQEGAQKTPASPQTAQKGKEQAIEKRPQHGSMTKAFKSPATGGAIAGALVLGAATLWGALEAAVGAGAAYLAYRALRRRRTPAH